MSIGDCPHWPECGHQSHGACDATGPGDARVPKVCTGCPSPAHCTEAPATRCGFGRPPLHQPKPEKRATGPQFGLPGEVLGYGYPDWPADLTTYAERKAYQRGIADARALEKYFAPEPATQTGRAQPAIKSIAPPDVKRAAMGLRGPKCHE